MVGVVEEHCGEVPFAKICHPTPSSTSLYAMLERLIQKSAAAERNKIAKWIIARGYSTGHGDTVADLLKELELTVREEERELCAQQKPWVKTYSGGKPNYTVPEEQTCQWQGLTDEEIAEMHNEIKVRLMGTYRTEDIYRAIEAKLREKNND